MQLMMFRFTPCPATVVSQGSLIRKGLQPDQRGKTSEMVTHLHVSALLSSALAMDYNIWVNEVGLWQKTSQRAHESKLFPCQERKLKRLFSPTENSHKTGSLSWCDTIQ